MTSPFAPDGSLRTTQSPFRSDGSLVEQGLTGELGAAMRRATDFTPDQMAEARALSRRVGLSPSVVVRNLAEVKAMAGDRQFDPGQFVRENPRAAEWLAWAENATLAQDDTQNLAESEKLFGRGTFLDRYLTQFGQIGQAPSQQRDVTQRPREVTEGVFQRRMDRGTAIVARGNLGVRRLFGDDSPDTEREVRALDALLAEPIPEVKGIGRFIAGTAEILPSMAPGIALGAAGATLGGLGATALGLGATQAAAASAGGGFLGRYLSSFALEGGNAMLDYESLTDENGVKVSPAVARAAALGVGAVAGALDAISLGVVLQQFGVVGRQALAGSMANVLQDMTMRRALLNGTRAWAKGVGSETLTETVQQGVALLGEQAARDYTNWLDGGNFATIPGGRVGAELLTTAIETAIGTTLIAGVGGGVRTLADVQRIAQAESEAQMLVEAVDVAEASKLRQRDPEAFADAVRSVIPEERQSVAMDAETLVMRLQEASVPLAQFAQSVGVDEATITDAANGGRDVLLPTANVLARLVGTDLMPMLLPDLKLRPDGLSQREAQEQAKEIDAQLEPLRQEMAEIAANGTEDASGQRVIADIVAQLTAGSIGLPKGAAFTPENIQATAQGLGAFYIAYGKKLELDPFAFYQSRNYRVVDPSVAEPIVAARRRVDEARKAGNAQAIAQAEAAYVALVGEATGPMREQAATNGEPVTAQERADFLAQEQTPATLPDTLDVDGTMRPTRNSNGQPIHPTEEGVRNFWRWSTEGGRQPIVDENGLPRVFYHGTPTPTFDEFGVEDTPQRNRGAYFTSDPEMASGYAARRGLIRMAPDGAVYPVYLRSAALNRIDAGRTTWDNIRVPGVKWSQRVFGNLPKNAVSVPKYITPLLESGEADAVVIDNVRDPSYNDDYKSFATVVAVANPDQIKSALGNTGEFGPTPNILRQGGMEPNAFIIPSAGPKLIGLMRTANLSSVLHEFSHDWLSVLIEYGQRPDAPQATKDDLAVTLKWLGKSSVAEIDGAAEEQFARAAERYFATADAPSRGLERAFVRFRSWMARIYRGVREMLGPIDPEIAGVFDRMLASDDEIAAARRDAGNDPMFTAADAEALGKSPSEMHDYEKAAVLADAQQRAALLKALLDERLSETRKVRREQETAFREQFTAEVDAEPVYQVRAALTAEDGPRLNRGAFVAQYGEDAVKQMPRKSVVEDGGVDADALALAYGFPDGVAVVSALQSAPRRDAEIARRVREAMAEAFPDPMERSDVLRRMAAEVVHGADSDKLIYDELKALSKVSGIRPPNVQAVKQAAREILATMPLVDIRPNAYLNAERKAATKATEAWKSGNAGAAEFHKRQQLLNHILYRESLEAAKVEEKVRTYHRRMRTEAAQKVLGKAGTLWVDAMDWVLARVDVTRQSRRATRAMAEQRNALSQWIDVMEAQDESVLVDDRIREMAMARPLASLTLAEAQGLYDTMKQVYTTAQRQQELLAGERRVNFEATKERMLATVAERKAAWGQNRPANVTATFGDSVLSLVDQAHGELLKAQTVLRLLDGDQRGVFTETAWDGYNDGATFEATELEKAAKRLDALYKRLTPARRKSYFEKPLAIAGLTTGPNAPLGKFTGWDAFYLALNWGNEGNKTAVVNGRYRGRQVWTTDMVERVIGTLTAEELQVVNDIWAFLDEYWPLAATLQREQSGITPDKVEAEPFPLLSSDGKVVQMRGGYYPLKYDGRFSANAETKGILKAMQDAVAGQLGAPSKFTAMTKHDHLKARAGSGGMPVLLDGSVLTRHLSEVIHDLAFRRWVRNMNRILGDQQIAEAVRTAMGPSAYRVGLVGWVQAVAGGNVAPKNLWERAIERARAGSTMVGLGFRLSTGLLQATGMLPALSKVKPVYLAKAAAQASKNPRAFLRDAKSLFRAVKERRENFDRDIRDAALRQGKLLPKDAIAFAHIGFMDEYVASLVAFGAYYQSVQSGMTPEQARKEASDLVTVTQGAGRVGDLSGIQRGSPLTKIISLFYSYGSALYQMFYASTRGLREKRISKPQFLGAMLAIWILPSVADNAIRILLGQGPDEGDTPEEKAVWWAWRVGTYPVQTLPLVRDLVNAMDPTSPYPYNFTPVERAFTSVVSGARAVVELAVEDQPLSEGDYRNFVDGVGYWFKIPTGQPWTTGTALYDWMMGYDYPESAARTPAFLFSSRR